MCMYMYMYMYLYVYLYIQYMCCGFYVYYMHVYIWHILHTHVLGPTAFSLSVVIPVSCAHSCSSSCSFKKLLVLCCKRPRGSTIDKTLSVQGRFPQPVHLICIHIHGEIANTSYTWVGQSLESERSQGFQCKLSSWSKLKASPFANGGTSAQRGSLADARSHNGSGVRLGPWPNSFFRPGAWALGPLCVHVPLPVLSALTKFRLLEQILPPHIWKVLHN